MSPTKIMQTARRRPRWRRGLSSIDGPADLSRVWSALRGSSEWDGEIHRLGVDVSISDRYKPDLRAGLFTPGEMVADLRLVRSDGAADDM